MYRHPGRAYSHFKSPDSMRQVIDREAKTLVLSNAQGAFEGSPNSKTIMTGVENKAKVIPLENLTIGQYDPIGEEDVKDIRKMSHRDLLALEQKGRGINLAGNPPRISKPPPRVICPMPAPGCGKSILDIKGGAYNVGFKSLKGKGIGLAGQHGGAYNVGFIGGGIGLAGQHGGGDLPGTFYGVILPALLNHLNLPADAKVLRRLMTITKKDFEKTQDNKRLIEMVAEDYVKLLVGDEMTGSGKAGLKNLIQKALVKSMDGRKLTGSGIADTFRNVIKTVTPYIKKAGKWAWDNKETLGKIALAGAKLLL